MIYKTTLNGIKRNNLKDQFPLLSIAVFSQFVFIYFVLVFFSSHKNKLHLYTVSSDLEFRLNFKLTDKNVFFSPSLEFDFKIVINDDAFTDKIFMDKV